VPSSLTMPVTSLLAKTISFGVGAFLTLVPRCDGIPTVGVVVPMKSERMLGPITDDSSDDEVGEDVGALDSEEEEHSEEETGKF